MALSNSDIIRAIDVSPMNRGLRGSDWLQTPGNIPISFDSGNLALFDHCQDHDYEMHLLFSVGKRQGIADVQSAYRQMFEKHGAQLLYGLIPNELPAVKLFMRWTGAKSAGIRDTSNGPCELFILSKEMWTYKGLDS